MEFYECVSYVIEKMRAFQEEILIDCNENAEAVLVEALNTNLKLDFYFAGVEAFVDPVTRKVKVKVQYRNKEVPTSQVIVLTKEADATPKLSQTMGNYGDRLVIVAPKEKNIDPMKIYSTINDYLIGYYPDLENCAIYDMSNALVNIYDFRLKYRLSLEQLSKMNEEVTAEVKRVAGLLFKPYMPDYVKIFLAHNYLCVNTEYYLMENADAYERAYRQSAYGALIMKKCVCQGYADAFQKLMEEAKIESDIVCGQILGDSEYHAWNVVSLNGGEDNFHIDITWDDVTQKPTYRYFGKSDLDLSGERMWNKAYTFKCRSDKNLLEMARHYVSVNRFKLIGDKVPLNVLNLM